MRQTIGKEFFAHRGQIVVPAQLGAKAGGCATIRVEHQLHILKMAFRRALTYFSQHLRGVVVGGSAKFAEGGKKMIVARFRAGMELAHGKGIEQVAIERRILQNHAGGRLVVARITWRLYQGEGDAVNAQFILDCPIDEAFRINCAGEMVVKVSAFGHLLQEGMQEQRLVAD